MRCEIMKFFIQLDERYIDPLINLITSELDDDGGTMVLDPEYEQLLNDVLSVLENIKKDMNDKLNEEEINIMKKRFHDIGEDKNDI